MHAIPGADAGASAGAGMEIAVGSKAVSLVRHSSSLS